MCSSKGHFEEHLHRAIRLQARRGLHPGETRDGSTGFFATRRGPVRSPGGGWREAAKGRRGCGTYNPSIRMSLQNLVVF